jgi:TolB-like protein
VKHSDILDSWKDISDYLERDVRTCRRWESELELPVYRINENSTHSKVFAYKSEIDKWLKDKTSNKNTTKQYILINKRILVGVIILSVLLISIIVLTMSDNLKSLLSQDQPTLAIFPFSNMNHQDHEEYFSQSILNGMIRNISRTGKIKVIEVSSMADSDKDQKSPQQIAKYLGADYMLVGKTEKQSTRFLISILLSSTKDQKKIWEEKCEGELKEILTVQHLLCTKLHEKLGIYGDQLNLNSSKAPQIQNNEAYDNYLKGNFILNKFKDNNKKSWKLYYQGRYFLGGYTRESNELAMNLFNEALKLDINFALAYLGLAQCYINYINLNWDFDIKWLDKAEEMAKKAKELSSECPEYFTISIMNCLIREVGFCENQESYVYQLVDDAIGKYPNDPQVNSAVGFFYFVQFGKNGSQQDFERALQYKEKSFWLDPSDVDNITYAELLMLKKDFQEAFDVCNLMRRHSPSLLIKFRIGEIYYYMGELEKSLEIFQDFQDAPLELKIDSLLYAGMIAAQKDDGDKALNILEEIELLAPDEFIITESLKMASIYFGIERAERAYQLLELFFLKQITKNSHYTFCKYIDIDKNFKNFRDRRRFIKTIKSQEETDG